MNFENAVKNITMVSFAGRVAFLKGHAGIGKSQIPKAVKKLYIENYNERAKKGEEYTDDDIDIVTLFGSLLKEGELGGIPVPRKDEETGKMINDYTTHVKMQRILDNDAAGKITILFIDEINRCENAVQQELMQLILDRQINETILPDSCAIICAGNPEVDDDNDYQVTIMNDALKNRFFQFTLDSDTEEWIKWASKNDVDPDVVEFIAEFPNMLHTPHSKESIKTTPRGVEMFSDAYKMSKEFYSGAELEDMVMVQASGICGKTWATQFVSFIRNKENPLVKPQEIFESSEEEFKKKCDKIHNESPLRQFIIIDRSIKYMEKLIEKGNLTHKNAEGKTKCMRFIHVFKIIPKDSMIGILKDISKNHKEIYELFTNFNEFMDVFFDANKMASAAKE